MNHRVHPLTPVLRAWSFIVPTVSSTSWPATGRWSPESSSTTASTPSPSSAPRQDLPIYDYTMHTRSKETMRVYPKPVIIVEGILILEDARLRELMDLKVYVDTDADERLIRRILRDTKERGRSLESILTQYQNTVKPMHEEFIEPSKKHADIIIPRGGENTPAIEMLVQHLKTFLDKNEKK